MLHKIKDTRKEILIAAIWMLMAAISMLFAVPTNTYAYTATAGTVNDGPVRVRVSPVDGDKITLLYAGTAVTVIDEVSGSDGYVWYQIQYAASSGTGTGYIRSDFVTLSNGNTTGDSSTSTGTTGVVDNTNLGVYVRSGAGTSYSAVTKVYKGQVVTILGQTESGGMTWYNVSLTVGETGYTGWMCADYVTVSGATIGGTTGVTPSTDADSEYVAALKAAGFPESYCNALLALHQKYPNWQFVAVQTGLDWSTAVANESVVGRNLVQSAVNDARKSTDTAAYNWETNTWYGFDGASWVSASPEYIAYCMDPRNFLNETYIFQFETLEYAAYQNASGVSNILSGTFMSGNYTDTDGAVRSYADTFVTVGSSLGVSPYHLASRCKQEQGTKGTSPLISGKYAGYEGYYNYFNIRAYTTALASSTVNGLAYAKEQGWNSIYKSIAGGSSVVANNYVKKGQNTIYFEKFNVVYQASLYSHQYMTNVMAAISEGSSMSKAYTDKTQAFVFRIPVYNNMPESAVTFADKGNPNNYLSALTVNGYNLTPAFSGSNTEYTLVVGSDVSSISVSASAVAGTSKVSGTGNYALNYGNNTINITCISQSGVSKTYTITVARQQPAVTGTTIDLGNGAAITSAYTVGTYMTAIQPGTTVSAFLTNVAATGCTVKVLKADGTENTGNVGTGNKVTICDANGTVIKQYEAVVYGDVNGDGKVSNADVVLLQKQILGITQQGGCYLEAANTSHDGGVTNKDLVILQKHILGISTISQ
jgi:beta-N-acetylglucosaminidase